MKEMRRLNKKKERNKTYSRISLKGGKSVK